MKKSVYWGLSFLGIAALIIASSLNLLNGLGFWTVFLTIVFLSVLVDGIVDFSVGNVAFSCAFLYMIWDGPLNLPHISAVSLLFAAFFTTIGLNLLLKRMRVEAFKNKHMKRFEAHIDSFEKNAERFEDGSNVEYDAGEHIMCKSRYGGMKKYITSQNLQSVLVDVSFGSGEIYFDQANAPTGVVDMEIDCSFGGIKIYIPRSWAIENNISNTMGAISTHGSPTGENLVTIKARGDINAGSIDIRYV